MDNQEHLNKAKQHKERIGIWLAFYSTSNTEHKEIMRLIDDYADAIHAYRLSELVKRV